MNGVNCVYSVTLHALQAFGKDEQALVGHAHDFVHHRQASHREQVGRLRRIHPRFALRHHDDGLVLAQGVDQLHRTFPAHGQRQHRMGKQHRVAHRQHAAGCGLLPNRLAVLGQFTSNSLFSLDI